MAEEPITRALRQRNEVSRLREQFARYTKPDPRLTADDFDLSAAPIFGRKGRSLSPTMAALWCDSHDIDAATMAASILGHMNPAPLQALYVISAGESVSKIGISNNVRNRLESLQTSSPWDLVVRAVVWVSPSTSRLEAATLKMLAERGQRMRGEWASLGWQEALATVFEAADRMGARVTPSAAMVRNLIFAILPDLVAQERDKCGDRISLFVADAVADSKGQRPRYFLGQR